MVFEGRRRGLAFVVAEGHYCFDIEIIWSCVGTIEGRLENRRWAGVVVGDNANADVEGGRAVALVGWVLGDWRGGATAGAVGSEEGARRGWRVGRVVT